MSRPSRLRLGTSLAALLLATAATAAESTLLDAIRDDDREALEALALYPDEIRVAILEVSAHPQALVRIHNVQRRSSAAFRDLLGGLPREEQKELWELTRYPELVAELASGGQKSRGAIREIVGRYPAEIRDTASEAARERHELLVQIHALHAESNIAFDKIVSSYPPATQAGLRTLLPVPEVLNILTDHMHMTVLVGGAYEEDPEAVSEHLAALHLEAARRNAEAREDWVKTLEEDPEALEELELAAEEYAAEQGTELEEVDEPKVDVYVGFWWRPYPYWFGYPHWYVALYPGYPSYYYWRPYPYWYHCGFYYGPRRTIVYLGLPSFHFAHWHFSRTHHHQRYPHLTHRMLRHYERHRRARDGVYSAASEWMEVHGSRVGRSWLADDGRRPERIAEYGRLEAAYRQHRRDEPFSRTTRRQLMERDARSYPLLNERAQNAARARSESVGRAEGRDRPERSPLPEQTGSSTETRTRPRPETVAPDRPQPSTRSSDRASERSRAADSARRKIERRDPERERGRSTSTREMRRRTGASERHDHSWRRSQQRGRSSSRPKARSESSSSRRSSSGESGRGGSAGRRMRGER